MVVTKIKSFTTYHQKIVW